jgi:hypothetical protein
MVQLGSSHSSCSAPLVGLGDWPWLSSYRGRFDEGRTAGTPGSRQSAPWPAGTLPHRRSLACCVRLAPVCLTGPRLRTGITEDRGLIDRIESSPGRYCWHGEETGTAEADDRRVGSSRCSDLTLTSRLERADLIVVGMSAGKGEGDVRLDQRDVAPPRSVMNSRRFIR